MTAMLGVWLGVWEPEPDRFWLGRVHRAVLIRTPNGHVKGLDLRLDSHNVMRPCVYDFTDRFDAALRDGRCTSLATVQPRFVFDRSSPAMLSQLVSKHQALDAFEQHAYDFESSVDMKSFEHDPKYYYATLEHTYKGRKDCQDWLADYWSSFQTRHAKDIQSGALVITGPMTEPDPRPQVPIWQQTSPTGPKRPLRFYPATELSDADIKRAFAMKDGQLIRQYVAEIRSRTEGLPRSEARNPRY